MDFCAFTNIVELPDPVIGSPKVVRAPKVQKNNKLHYKILSNPISPQRNVKAQVKAKIQSPINISNFYQKYKRTENKEKNHSYVYHHVFEKDLDFDQTLKFHKEFKSLNHGKYDFSKNSEREVVFSIKKIDTKRNGFNNYDKRCKTALFSYRDEGSDENLKKRFIKYNRFIRKELIPQTKANVMSKSNSPDGSLTINGIIKDIAIRKCTNYNF